MTTNYNPANFFNKDSESSKLNDNNLNEFNNSGRCNNCSFFNFGRKSCTKKNENGDFVRPNPLTTTVTTQTNKGNFINFVKPIDCNDFQGKSTNKTNNKKNVVSQQPFAPMPNEFVETSGEN